MIIVQRSVVHRTIMHVRGVIVFISPQFFALTEAASFAALSTYVIC